ncbi:hypothetical protein [Breoghania sp.]|uniref:hypothetical protein n=1 Tax=Breoghania sp. TaxID=2065378 RepID=UPI00261AAE78|nr:hypothetical protein [Breoghania sp.]MDJ0933515.1 hypothetical protein [Breoghania sp.]
MTDTLVAETTSRDKQKLTRGLAKSDPLVAPVLSLAADLLGPIADADRNRIGLIMLGDNSAHHVADKVRTKLKARGRVSPIEFVNANSGAPIPVACTRLGLRGPTMNFVSGGEMTRTAADILARRWLRGGDAIAIVILESGLTDEGKSALSARLLKPGTDTAGREDVYLTAEF